MRGEVSLRISQKKTENLAGQLYSQELNLREIQQHLPEIYKVEVSIALISLER